MQSHLCLFTDSLEPSGVGQHMLALAAELGAHYRISIICPPSSGGRRLLAQAHALGLATLALEARYDQPAALARLCDWLQTQRVMIFHGHAGIGWEGFGGVDAARAAGVPAVVRTEHLPYLLTHPQQRADHARIVRAVDRLICVSHKVAATHVAAGAPPDKVRVVRNGIPIRSVRPDRAGARAHLGLPPAAPIAVTVGRFTEQKGHRYLLDAIPAVLAHVPAASFLWVGSGELEGDLRAQVQQRRLGDHIRFLGHCPDITQVLAAADLFVLPSLFEGLPLVVLEAMAAGLPVVATRVCGTSEAILDGTTGRLVPARDAAALARALLEALEHPDRAAHWGHAGRGRVVRWFSARRMAAETVAVYEEALDRRVPLPSSVPATTFITYPEA